MSSSKLMCPYCKIKFHREELISHIDKKHNELIPEGYTSRRLVFDIANPNEIKRGKCRICGNNTEWNENSGRYNVLCTNPQCKKLLHERYKKNTIKVYGKSGAGKSTLLNDPEMQEKMLANRKISGTYTFTDGGKVGYTGSFERQALEFMDKYMEIKSEDIMSPGPAMEYDYKGSKHMYIPDFLYIPYNLIIEVKDGGAKPNNHISPSRIDSKQRTIEKEKLFTSEGDYNYIRLTNNEFVQLINVFMDLKYKQLIGDYRKAVHINESKDASIVRDDFKKGKKRGIKFIDGSSAEAYKYYKKYNDNLYENMKNNWLAPHGAKAIVAIDIKKDMIAGYVCVRKDGNIQPIFVYPEYRGFGISTELMKRAIKDCGAKKLGVWEDNEVAIKLYKSMGFEEYKRKHYKDGADAIMMQLKEEYDLISSYEVDLSSFIINEVSTVVDGLGKCEIKIYGNHEGDNEPHMHIKSANSIYINGKKKKFDGCIKLHKAEFFAHANHTDTFKDLKGKASIQAAKSFNEYMNSIDKTTGKQMWAKLVDDWLNGNHKDVRNLRNMNKPNYEKLV